MKLDAGQFTKPAPWLIHKSDKTLKLYEGHYHDLLNDLGREQVMDDIVDWIDARIVPPSLKESQPSLAMS